MQKITPEFITELKENEVFVFGSNSDGQHFSGAAKIALEKFGAINGQGHGLQGHSYAIDSMSGIRTLEDEIKTFTQFAKENSTLTFLVTKIGCGIAGFKEREIAPIFKEALGVGNISLPVEFTYKYGYKVTDNNMQCRDFQYELNKVYYFDGKISICNRGFHYCERITSCFGYYSFNSDNRVFEVVDRGETITEDNKSCTNNIELVRELSWYEVLGLANTGRGNTGHSNSGNRNSGYSNSGDSNSGDRNSGDSNSGDSNSGDSNSGNRNSGYSNSGDSNSGNRNSGDRNSGDSNSGDSNSGDSNSGYSNSGDSNSGYSNSGDSNSGDSNSGDSNSGYSNSGNRNSGYSNSGNRNSGYSNSGDSNSGNRNSGNRNSGYSNSGDSNSGNRNSGYSNSGNRNSGYSNSGNDHTGSFNTEREPKYTLFNKPSKWTYQNFFDSTAYRLLMSVDTTMWVPTYQMTEEEKKQNPRYEAPEGYVKYIAYKEAFTNAWGNWSESSRKAFTSLPNFDADIFEEITGVNVNAK